MAIISAAYPKFVPAGYYGDTTTTRIKAVASSTNSTLVKSTAGSVLAITVANNAGAARYVRFYDKATAPTIGTDVPAFTLVLEATTAPCTISIPAGIPFSSGIGFGISTGVADSDTGNTSADDVHGFIIWS
jgi:hypothetical protein